MVCRMLTSLKIVRKGQNPVMRVPAHQVLIKPLPASRMQAQLVEQGAKSHAEASEEYYHAERDYTRAQHTVEEIEVCKLRGIMIVEPVGVLHQLCCQPHPLLARHLGDKYLLHAHVVCLTPVCLLARTQASDLRNSAPTRATISLLVYLSSRILSSTPQTKIRNLGLESKQRRLAEARAAYDAEKQRLSGLYGPAEKLRSEADAAQDAVNTKVQDNPRAPIVCCCTLRCCLCSHLPGAKLLDDDDAVDVGKC